MALVLDTTGIIDATAMRAHGFTKVIASMGVVKVLGVAAGVILAYQLATVLYNVFLHPLAGFPGPLSRRASRLPWAISVVRRVQPFQTQKLHEQYGPVVRIAPNHLSFTHPQAMRDIYGSRLAVAGVKGKSGAAKANEPQSQQQQQQQQPSPPPPPPPQPQPQPPEMAKLPAIYDNSPSEKVTIINAPLGMHRRLRRVLAKSFSEQAMRAQEPTIQRYVDMLVCRLKGGICAGDQDGGGSGSNNSSSSAVFDMTEHYNWLTFDIIGDLVFGEPFGCVEQGRRHAWVDSILTLVRYGPVANAISYLGYQWLVPLLARLASYNPAREMAELTGAKMKARMDMRAGREDLSEALIRKKDDLGLDFDSLAGNANILTVAGSETTATTLAGATYLLTRHPAILDSVAREVRSSFRSADDITIAAVGKLPLMLAALSETLRMYPPATAQLIRVVPDGGCVIGGHWVPGKTYVEVQHWSANHDSANWTDPWEFRPERFLGRGGREGGEGSKKGDRLDALQVFSMGPRNCIGQNLANVEMRIVLARMLFEFDLHLEPESRDWIGSQRTNTLWEKIPLRIRITRANHA